MRGVRVVLSAAAEDVEAFWDLYRRHARWVLGFLGAVLVRASRAADVASEVFAAALLGS